MSTGGEFHPIQQHADWMPIARRSYRRVADAFAGLADDDWALPTPCTGWAVRDLGGHLVGAMRAAARLRETASQQMAVARRVRRTGELAVDAMTAIQIERTASLTPVALVAEMSALVEPAVAGRSRIPGSIRRRVRVRVDLGEIDERWSLDYFLGCILTRDTWLHRIDLADALGRQPELDDDDRAIVGDVACEWVRRHAEPVRLVLTGPAGGTLTAGEGGEEVVVDAVDFCRIVSGRAAAFHPLLAQPVPF